MVNNPPHALRRLFSQLLRAETDEATRQAAGALLEDTLRQTPAPPLPLPDALQQEQLNTVLSGYAPTALLQWDWLRRISHPAQGHQPVNSALFAAYLDAVGLDDPDQSPAAQYRALGTRASCPPLDLPPCPPYPHDDFADNIRLLPCLMLSLSRFPSVRLGEILGFTLDYCQDVGWLDWLERQLLSHALPNDYCLRQRALRAKHLPALLPYCDLPGVEQGRALYRHGQHALLHALQQALTTPPSLAQRAATLLRHKQPYALGHHGRIELQGKTLDQWLAEGDWAALHQALRHSPYLDLQAMEHCRFSRSMAFGGAMFGVFTPQQQALLRAWLQEASPAGENVAPIARAARRPEPDSSAAVQAAPCADTRHLYHQLLNSESYPHSLPAAARYAQTLLTRTRWLTPLQPKLRRAFAYEAEVFFQRVEAIYQREMARYRPLTGQPQLPRAMYVWGIRQMAPAILLDGCWLANLAAVEPAQDEIRKRLLRIFADEVGCGQPEQHHANVYRRLLESLDIQLPEVTSLAFAEHADLNDAAFVLPCYLLAIGLHPERFFPEILGLNLAIELSGLGAGYMRLIDALRYYGIDPTILQLHLSIDNLASGHAALARAAIMRYMAQIQSQGGPDAVAATWPRVWNGYLSLTSAGLPFAWAGVRRYASSPSE